MDRLQPAPGSAGAVGAGCQPARPPREGQGSKCSWLPADNPAWAGTAASSAGFSCRSPAERARAQARGLSHQGSRTAAAAAATAAEMLGPVLRSQPQSHWYAGGGAAGRLCHTALFPHKQEARATGNITLQALWGLDRMQQPVGLQVVARLHPRWKGLRLDSWSQGKGGGRHRAPQMQYSGHDT